MAEEDTLDTFVAPSYRKQRAKPSSKETKAAAAEAAQFAKGGSVSVYDPTKIDAIINGIDDPQGFAEGGSVSVYDSDRVDAIANQYM